jgi:glycosyltransferase involved in cell wall biosynthesis
LPAFHSCRLPSIQNKNLRNRVLLLHPSFQPPGGGNAVAAWMLHALLERHHVGVMSWTAPEWAEVDRFYGTALSSCEVFLEPLPRWMRTVRRMLPAGGHLLKHALLLRAAVAAGADYDIVVSANNETDLGRTGIQYIHYPARLRPRPAHDQRWYHRIPFLLALYYRLGDRLAGFSAERMRRNLTLTNSDWTGKLVQRLYGVATRTLYPPICVNASFPPWADRPDAFICVGRLNREKAFDRVIDIVTQVRRTVAHVTLTIVGSSGSAAYRRHLLNRVETEGRWITFLENLPRHELLDLIGRHRYGIHGMAAEHFGMAPAEMAAAGCIVFVPNDGGQVEIVGGHRPLLYDTTEGAVAAIVRVMNDPVEQQRLRALLEARAQLFSVERFASAFREIVEECVRSHDLASPAARQGRS